MLQIYYYRRAYHLKENGYEETLVVRQKVKSRPIGNTIKEKGEILISKTRRPGPNPYM